MSATGSFGLQRRHSQHLNACNFHVGIFSVAHCIAVTQLGSGFLAEETVLCVAMHSVCPCEEGNSGASYVATLVKSFKL